MILALNSSRPLVFNRFSGNGTDGYRREVERGRFAAERWDLFTSRYDNSVEELFLFFSGFVIWAVLWFGVFVFCWFRFIWMWIDVNLGDLDRKKSRFDVFREEFLFIDRFCLLCIWFLFLLIHWFGSIGTDAVFLWIGIKRLPFNSRVSKKNDDYYGFGVLIRFFVQVDLLKIWWTSATYYVLVLCKMGKKFWILCNDKINK